MTNYYGLFPDVLILVCCVPKNQTKADFQVLNHSYWISLVKNILRPGTTIYLLPLVCLQKWFEKYALLHLQNQKKSQLKMSFLKIRTAGLSAIIPLLKTLSEVLEWIQWRQFKL